MEELTKFVYEYFMNIWKHYVVDKKEGGKYRWHHIRNRICHQLNSTLRRAESQFNAANRKLKTEMNKLDSQNRRLKNEFQKVEREIKSYQRKLSSSSNFSLPMNSVSSLYLGDNRENSLYDYHVDDISKEYDVFISHASEDKELVARPLAQALRQRGLKVWFDEFELRLGDSLRKNIDKGVARSKFGVVILSRNFINKGWTNYELDGIVTRSIDGKQQILPIWHDITRNEVMNFSPSLADKVARSTTEFMVEEIADMIIEKKEQ